MKPKQRELEIKKVLTQHGLVKSRHLAEMIGINRMTLSRSLERAEFDVTKVGAGKATHYGLPRTIRSIGNQVPIFRVDVEGRLQTYGKLRFFQNGKYFQEPQNLTLDSQPIEMTNLHPQGFMGRAFCKKYHKELDLPENLQDWSDDHFLIAISKKGEDLPGNVIVGSESARRWQKKKYDPQSETGYTALAKRAYKGQPAGSSAGGEMQKFSSFVKGKHCIVKFAGIENTAAEKRWCDLLVCESVALETLNEFGIESAKTRILQDQGMTFLESQRFDRIKKKGRGPLVTLFSTDAHFIGDALRWSKTAETLADKNLISSHDSKKIKFVEAYSQWIGDTDRHFSNISMLPKGRKFQLAPIYDKLPMMFAPVKERIVEREFKIPVPESEVIEVWEEARGVAILFWKRVCKDTRISSEFKKISRQCLKLIQDCLA